MEQFQSSRIAFPAEDAAIFKNSPGRYPQPLGFLFEKVLSWSPTGAPSPLKIACDDRVWGARLRDPRLSSSVQLQGALMKRYFQDCTSEIQNGSTSTFANLVKTMTIRYVPNEHPFLRKVVLNLPGNIKLKGLLALKGDLKRRPMVIIRPGIFANIMDFIPERAWMIMLFEQSPFNVLLVENMTGGDFIQNNSRVSFGGYDEGLQNIVISRWLSDPVEPISKIVSSVHLFGISLGGHGTLFASLLNKFNSSSDRSLINSFTALCPVVDLQASMQAITDGGTMSTLVDLWSRERLDGIEERLPSVYPHARFAFLKNATSEIARTYQGGLSYNSSITLPAGMKDGSNFWELNDFWSRYKDVQEPVLIFATSKDPAVPFSLNSQKLVNKEIKLDSKNIRVIELPQGVHCTLAVPYDWHTLATLFQSYILSHAPEVLMEERKLDIDLYDEEWKDFAEKGVTAHFSVSEPSSKASFVTVEVKLTNSQGQKKTMNLSLPLSQFDFRFLNEELSASEKKMIVRWVNQNLHVSLEQKKQGPSLKAQWSVVK